MKARLEKLIGAVHQNRSVEWTGKDLNVSSQPDPYISPKFHFVSGKGTTAKDKLDAEVIFVQAPAAVGKSVTAKYVSSCSNAPVLDLARTPVASESLNGLISSEALFEKSHDPTKAMNEFHAGRLPIIVDALDEGRMKSGIDSFDAFVESTAGLIKKQRHTTNRSKIIFFGRPEAVGDSEAGIDLFGDEEITSCIVELDFFEKPDATKMVKAYARKEIEEDVSLSESEKLNRIERIAQKKPIDELISEYFSKIESALHIETRMNRWGDDTGEGFAGYAPVLYSIGHLLAKMKNPHQEIQELRGEAGQHGWSMIEKVVQHILEREQGKLTDRLEEKYSGELDSEALSKAYDPGEQLMHLTQYLQGQQISTDRVRFSMSAHNTDYIEKVETFVREHPFVKNGKAINEVFGSFIFAHAVRYDLLKEGFGISELGRLSRFPFLWRWLRRQMRKPSDPASLNGKYVGYLLRSYCNDPAETTETAIHISGASDRIKINCQDRFGFTARSPLVLFGGIRNCRVEIGDLEFLIIGDSVDDDDRSIFRFEGDNDINCRQADIRTEVVVLDGSLSIDVEHELLQIKPTAIRMRSKSKLVAFGATVNYDQWSDYADTRPQDGDIQMSSDAEKVAKLIRLASMKSKMSFVYTDKNFNLENNSEVAWLRRSPIYKEFLMTLVGSGLAKKTSEDTSGVYNQKVAFRVDWDRLLEQGRTGKGSDLEMRKFWKRWS